MGQLRRSKAKSRASKQGEPPSHLLPLTIHRTGKKENHSANFFSSENDEAARQREILAEESLEMLITWLHEGGNVAIHGEIVIFGSKTSLIPIS